jgi:uncharacterized lipoprotein YddW (UPF0748 family)
MFYSYKTVLLLAFFFVFGRSQSNSKGFHIYNSQQPKYETRAVWLTTIKGLDWPRIKATDAEGVKRQQEALCSILDRLQRININTVILQTRIRGTVIYPSQYEPWDECLTGQPGKHPGYDPLAFCIDECHKRGMELHAWLVCIPLGNVAKQKQYGLQSITKRKPQLCKTVGQEIFMLPGQPETADYIATLCREIVENYDVDGISLDYIRYPESVFKFSDDELFPAPPADDGSKSAADGKKAAWRNRSRRKAARPKPSAAKLADWRRANITRIVRRIHDTVKPLKPWVKLSSSPIGKYDNLARYSSGGWNCYRAAYQDPQLWLRENLQDMLFPMMYFQGNNFYPFLFDWLEHSYGHPVLPGLGIYFLDPREGKWTVDIVRAQMHTARASGIGGMAFYRSDFLTRNLQGLYDRCADEFFPYPALTARISSDSVPPLPPIHVENNGERLCWQGSAHYYNIYGSNQWPVDCSKAENLLAARVVGNCYKTNGRVRYYAVAAADRFGSESLASQEERPNVRVINVGRLINRDIPGPRKGSASKKKRKK